MTFRHFTDPPVTDNDRPLDYSSLRQRKRLDRWSPLATVVYALTLIATLLFVASFSHPLQLVALLVSAGGVAAVGIWVSRLFFRQVSSPAQDDLWPFASANNLQIVINQPSANLSSQVYIRQRISFIAKLYIPWFFTIQLSLHGTYKTYPLSLYSLTMTAGAPSDSTIEQDAQYQHFMQPTEQATITFTVWQASRRSFLPGCGVILWEIPGLTHDDSRMIRRKLWWQSTVVDVQTDGNQLAVLLDSHIPYDRRGMIKLFSRLDRIAALVQLDGRR